MSMGIAAVGGSGMPQAVSGASSYASPTTKMSNLFSQIDSSGTGSINQAQFNHAFATQNPPRIFQTAGADAIFKQLNPGSSGSVSKQDFVSGMTGLMRSLRGGQTTETASGAESTSSASPADTLASSLSSLNQLGSASDPASNNGLGSLVNLFG